MSVFDAARFERFCAKLVIDTKERGQMPLRWNGCQRYMVEEIAKGLDAGKHTYVMLKGRQLGISTVSLALDLYWLFTHPGLQGAMVTDTEENRTLFRSNIVAYMNALPRGAKVPAIEHNRTQLVLKNRSRMNYLVAGTRSNGSLGRGKAVNFMHGTESSSWGDEEGLASLFATLAQQNPHRLYMFESTARGFNMYYEMWETAKASKTQGAIFVGWWRNEAYMKSPGSLEYKTYWDGNPTSDEREWMGEVFRTYKFSISDRQLAWWRWYNAEQAIDPNMALQEFPWLPEQAFQLSGSRFFSGEKINEMYRGAMDLEPRWFRWKFGVRFDQTEFVETNEENAECAIWEMPDPKGVYALGCDPAYGSSEWADEFSISVWRCYADRVEQVAEVGTAAWTTSNFAWVIAHLAGMYRNSLVILEMLGPGGAVYNEMQNLKMMAGMRGWDQTQQNMYDVTRNIRDYLYRRQDSMTGTLALQWQTNSREKNRIMETMRSYIERGAVVLKSMTTLEQMRNIRRKGDQVGGDGRAKDDRVIAAAYAITAGWNDTLMIEMQSQGRTYLAEHQPRQDGIVRTPLENAVRGMFESRGIRFGGQ